MFLLFFNINSETEKTANNWKCGFCVACQLSLQAGSRKQCWRPIMSRTSSESTSQHPPLTSHREHRTAEGYCIFICLKALWPCQSISSIKMPVTQENTEIHHHQWTVKNHYTFKRILDALHNKIYKELLWTGRDAEDVHRDSITSKGYLGSPEWPLKPNGELL